MTKESAWSQVCEPTKHRMVDVGKHSMWCMDCGTLYQDGRYLLPIRLMFTAGYGLVEDERKEDR